MRGPVAIDQTHSSPLRVAAYASLSGKATLPATASRRVSAAINTQEGRDASPMASAHARRSRPDRCGSRLAGQHQVDNAVTGLRAAEAWLGLKPEDNPERHFAMLAALGRTRWPGRLEKVASSPDLWIDVGHTPKALEAVTSHLPGILTARKNTRRVRRVRHPRKSPALPRIVASCFDHFIPTRAHKAGADVGAVRSNLPPSARTTSRSPQTRPTAAQLAKAARAAEGLTVLALGGFFLSAEVQHAWEGRDPRELEFL